MNAMLLNEFLKEHRKSAEIGSDDSGSKSKLKLSTSGLQKVSAQFEANNSRRKQSSTIPKAVLTGVFSLAFLCRIRHQPIPYETSSTMFHHVCSLCVRSFRE